MQGLQVAQLLEEWPEIKGGALQPIWASSLHHFHNCSSMPHDSSMAVVLLHNCTTAHDGFPFDLGSAGGKIGHS